MEFRNSFPCLSMFKVSYSGIRFITESKSLWLNNICIVDLCHMSSNILSKLQRRDNHCPIYYVPEINLPTHSLNYSALLPQLSGEKGFYSIARRT
jgi:hypothetical protein